MKRSLLASCLLLVITQTQAMTLKVATLSPDGSAWMVKMRAGASEIETRTQKRVAFKFYTGGTMGNDKAVLNKIKIFIKMHKFIPCHYVSKTSRKSIMCVVKWMLHYRKT